MPHPICLCIGAAHWDVIARASMVPGRGVDLPGSVSRRPGGVALNVAVGLVRAGIPSALCAAVGRDPEGNALVGWLASAGVPTSHLTRGSWPTGAYTAIEGPDGALFAAVADCTALDRAGETVLHPLLAGSVPRVVVADGNLAPAVLDRLFGLPCRLVLVPASTTKVARLRPALARGRATLVLNRLEAEALLGRPFRDSRMAAAALCAAGAYEAVVTDGAAAASRTGPEGTVSLEPPSVSGGVTGAGDAFAAALVAADLAGFRPAEGLGRALVASTRHIAGVR